MNRRKAFQVITCLILVFSFVSAPVSAAAPVTQLLSTFARPAGSYQENKAADLILKEFRGQGYQAVKQKFSAWAQNRSYSSSNIIAAKPQETQGPLVIIGAHYDSVPGSKGAIDNAASIEALLNIAQALGENPAPFEVRFVAFGAEEVGYLGSKHYVNTLSEEDQSRLLGYFNLDMVGYDDLQLATVTGSPNVLTQLFPDFQVDKQAKSDHAIFENFLGVPALTFYCDNPYYHTENDTFDKVNYTTLGQVQALVLQGLEQLARQMLEQE